MIRMSNAPEGRTYIIKTMERNPDYAQEAQAYRDKIAENPSLIFKPNGVFRPTSFITVETPLIVPNGKWILESYHGIGQVLHGGKGDMELQSFNPDGRNGVTVYVGDKPFGYVIGDGHYDRPRLRLVSARQVHKGELGRGVPTSHLNYVRQPFKPGEKLHMSARDRRRGYGWVKLSELAEIVVGYNPDEWIQLVLNYWRFSGHLEYRHGEAIGTLVDTMWGSKFDITSGEQEEVSMTFQEFATADPSELWIRRGFAYTILRLRALGVKPEVLQTT